MQIRRYSKKSKLAALAASIAVGAVVYAATYLYISADLTDWQKSQEIDFDNQTGSTKFKAHIDALSAGGIAFCMTAMTIITVATFARLAREKKNIR